MSASDTDPTSQYDGHDQDQEHDGNGDDRESTTTEDDVVRRRRHVFHHENDVLLLELVRELAPFKAMHGMITPLWEELATNYNSHYELQGNDRVTWQVLRNRFVTLMNKYRTDALHSLRRSGTNEESFTQLLATLEDLKNQMDDHRKLKTERKLSSGAGKPVDVAVAMQPTLKPRMEIAEDVLARVQKRLPTRDPSVEVDRKKPRTSLSTEEPVSLDVPRKPVDRVQRSGNGVSEVDIRRQELEVRKKELALQERRLELEMDVRQKELALHEKRLEIDSKKWDALEERLSQDRSLVIRLVEKVLEKC